jgi:fumarylacetoacetase
VTVDTTHDPKLRSWVASANEHPDFPIQNLPYGVYRHGIGEPRVGVAIGDQVLDLRSAVENGREWAEMGESWQRIVAACASTTLNRLMALEPEERMVLRQAVSRLLAADRSGRPVEGAAGPHLLTPNRDVQMLLPAEIGDYTDFYASVFHASNVGALFLVDRAERDERAAAQGAGPARSGGAAPIRPDQAAGLRAGAGRSCRAGQSAG